MHARAVRLLFARAFACAVAVIPLFAVAATTGADGAADRASIMRRASEHWLVAQASDGRLPYGFDLLADKSTGPATHPVIELARQAGSFYVWSEYYRLTRDDRLREPLKRALHALAKRSIPLGKSRAQTWLEATRILSIPVGRWRLNAALNRMNLLYEAEGSGKVVSPDGRHTNAHTTTLAFALLTELAYSAAASDEQFASLRHAWFGALGMLRIPGNGFRQTPDSIEESDYSNGEAWLAIAAYCERHPHERCMSLLADVDVAMLAHYSDRSSIAFYHWGAMAALRRYATTRDARFIDFLESQTRYFATSVRPRLQHDDNNCSAVEGVAATLAAFRRAGKEGTQESTELRAWLERELEKMPALQVQPGQKHMKLGGEVRLLVPRLSEFSGAFLAGIYAPQVRVDLTAHCLSALMIVEREGVFAAGN